MSDLELLKNYPSIYQTKLEVALRLAYIHKDELRGKTADVQDAAVDWLEKQFKEDDK